MGEFQLIDEFFRPLAGKSAAGLDLTDDAAILTPPEGRDLIMTADSMSAGVHFLADDPPETVARKLLRVNLSDLAAMGARPLGYLMTLALPRHTDRDWLAAFAGGLAVDQEAFSIALFGGDTTATDGPLCLSLTALGSVPRGKALRRSGARPGDRIYVSGTIGDAAVGLRVSTGGLVPDDPAAVSYLRNRYRLPEPRLSLAAALLDSDLATAAIDVSDGLLADLRHLSEESSVSAIVEAEAVPLSEPARTISAAGDVGLEDLLTGGDDYELLFTVRDGRDGEVVNLQAELGLPLTCIGQVGSGEGVEVRDSAGRSLAMERLGWEHF